MLALGAGLGGGVVTPAADACTSGIVCYDASARVGSTLPANTGAIAVALAHKPGDPDYGGGEVRLVRVDEDRDGVVATHFDESEGLLRLDETLVEGASYAIEMVTCDAPEATSIADFTAGPETPLPDVLGGAHLVGPTYQEMTLLSGGTYSCRRGVSGHVVEASVELDEAAAPWAGLFQYSATVDGQPYYDETWGDLGGAPPEGPGGTRVYRLCDDFSLEHEQGLPAGTHTVVLHAELPGTTIALETAPVDIALYCEGEAPPIDTGDDSEMSPPHAGGGCAITAHRASHASFIALLVSLLPLSLRRRPRTR